MLTRVPASPAVNAEAVLVDIPEEGPQNFGIEGPPNFGGKKNLCVLDFKKFLVNPLPPLAALAMCLSGPSIGHSKL